MTSVRESRGSPKSTSPKLYAQVVQRLEQGLTLCPRYSQHEKNAPLDTIKAFKIFEAYFKKITQCLSVEELRQTAFATTLRKGKYLCKQCENI